MIVSCCNRRGMSTFIRCPFRRRRSSSSCCTRNFRDTSDSISELRSCVNTQDGPVYESVRRPLCPQRGLLPAPQNQSLRAARNLLNRRKPPPSGLSLGRTVSHYVPLSRTDPFPDGSLVLGAPAKVVRPLTADERAQLKSSTDHYAHNAAYCLRHKINLSAPLGTS